MKKSATFLILLILFVICICAGSKSGKLPSEKCGDCHSHSPMYEEWQESAHASAIETILKDPDVGRSCLKCHSADYKRIRSNSWLSTKNIPTPQTAGNAVSCSSCHKHGSGREYNLIMPAEKLCISCHVLYCG